MALQLIVYSLATGRVRRFRYLTDEQQRMSAQDIALRFGATVPTAEDYWLPMGAGEGRLSRAPVPGEDAHETHVAVIVATGKMPTPLHHETERRALIAAPAATRTPCDLHSIVNGAGEAVNVIHACPDCGDRSEHYPGHRLIRHGADGKVPPEALTPLASS